MNHPAKYVPDTGADGSVTQTPQALSAAMWRVTRQAGKAAREHAGKVALTLGAAGLAATLAGADPAKAQDVATEVGTRRTLVADAGTTATDAIVPGLDISGIARDPSGRIVVADASSFQIAALPDTQNKTPFFTEERLAELTPNRITYENFGAFGPLKNILPVHVDPMANRRPATAIATRADMETFVPGGSQIVPRPLDPKAITADTLPRIMNAVTDYEGNPEILGWRLDEEGNRIFDVVPGPDGKWHLVARPGMEEKAVKLMAAMETVRRNNVYPFTNPEPGKEVPRKYLEERAKELRELVAQIPENVRSPWVFARVASAYFGMRWQARRHERMGIQHFNGKVETDPQTGATIYLPTENAANAYAQTAEILRMIAKEKPELLRGVELYDSMITVAGVTKKVTYAYVPDGPGRRYISRSLGIGDQFWKDADNALLDSGIARANEQIQENPAIAAFIAAQTPETVGWTKDLNTEIVRQMRQRSEIATNVKPETPDADKLRLWAVTQAMARISFADRVLAARLVKQTEKSLEARYDLNKAFGWQDPFGRWEWLDWDGVRETLGLDPEAKPAPTKPQVAERIRS